MSVFSVALSLATLLVIGSLCYLRLAAKRAGLKPEKEHGMVLGAFAAVIAIAGATGGNRWVSLVGFLVAATGVVFYAHRVVESIKRLRKQ